MSSTALQILNAIADGFDYDGVLALLSYRRGAQRHIQRVA
jgi:hypothetical protein